VVVGLSMVWSIYELMFKSCCFFGL